MAPLFPNRVLYRSRKVQTERKKKINKKKKELRKFFKIFIETFYEICVRLLNGTQKLGPDSRIQTRLKKNVKNCEFK
jgi:hypothetical protein